MIAGAPLRLRRSLSGVALYAVLATAAAAQTGDQAAPLSLNPMKALEKTTLKGFVEQPLFEPSRRLPPIVVAPVAFESPPPPTVPQPPPTLHLLGIIHGKQYVAIVHRDDDTKTLMLYSGDRVDDWTVKVLATNHLRLSRGDRNVDYALFGKSETGAVERGPTNRFEGSNLSQAMAARNARLQRRTY